MWTSAATGDDDDDDGDDGLGWVNTHVLLSRLFFLLLLFRCMIPKHIRFIFLYT